jgi:hypothetical protein
VLRLRAEGRPRRAWGGAGACDVVGRAGLSGAMAGAGAREEGGRGSRRGPRKKRGRNGEEEEEGSPHGGGEGAGGRRFPGDGRAGRRRRVARGLEREREGEILGGGESDRWGPQGEAAAAPTTARSTRVGSRGASWARGWATRG